MNSHICWDAGPRLVTWFKCVSLSLMAEQLLLHLLNSPGPQSGWHGCLAVAQGQLRSEQVEEVEQVQQSSGRAKGADLQRFFCLSQGKEAVVQTEDASSAGEEAPWIAQPRRCQGRNHRVQNCCTCCRLDKGIPWCARS